ncbi:endonuclease 4 [Candidatus Nitrososphaera gargensis Ga9.2]|uniref:Probable endonuclease 4 n=1 Tax=Nitrososphaera gargensis (strain Ga9.2) TaxID=1237085 RepID=K0IB43_NITGG|nr:deoxyribonuclease IV [Candidatus Nitrososphaera gargensis]AFU58551.1 endonuclease 4 [Candidatus Nitrososphaera gargensis Ga9.2]
MGIRVGFHVSIAGGISNSVDNAKKLGCTAFQIFSRNPRGWAAKPLAPDDVQLFKSKLATSGIEKNSVIVHMPYLPNLSGPDGEFYKKSVETLTGEIQRCSALGIPYLVIHLGSHMGKGQASGLSQLVKAIESARVKSDGGAPMVLLENNAGQKNCIGGNFEELRTILDKLDDPKKFGVCIDTCHLFVSGYDLRTKAEVDKTLEKFDNVVGLKELKFIHLNDSKGPLGSNLDRHEHIGLGSIGSEGLAAFLNHRAIRGLPVIMETPIDEKRGDEQNLQVVLGMVK